MQLIQFLEAWLFPGSQCFAMEMAAADSSDLDRASSSSPSFSANAAGSGSSPSSSSTSSDGHPAGFFNKSRWSRQESPSTTPLSFVAGGGRGGAGKRLLQGSRARAPAKQPQEEAAATMAPKVKVDVIGRYLRKISRRLRKARSDGKGSPSSSMPAAAVDDTARERAESVASAISYCKDTLRRGTSPSPSPSPPPSPRPSPSLDDWLHERQEEIVASAAAVHCDECSDPPPSFSHRRRGRDAGWPLGMQAMAKRVKESPCPASPRLDSSLAATAVAHGEVSAHHGHGWRGDSSMSSLDEMEFLKTFDGDEEMINHHFITVEI